MKWVVRFDMQSGQSYSVTFDDVANTFASSDGRSGGFRFAPSGGGAEAIFIIGGQEATLTYTKLMQEVGDSSPFTGPEGAGTATVVSRE